MGTKERLLELLEADRGVYASGEEIARRLSVSRAAVWKAVQALREEGYAIEAAPRKGYCLSGASDILSPQGIRKYLNPAYREMELTVLPVADSTNAVMRQKAQQGAPEPCALAAHAQTQGRGRLGRLFYSPQDTGIYMSLLLRPRGCSAQAATRLTTLAAVAVCEAIEAVSGRRAQIKWVNDVFVDGRKVCGILTEASLGMESGEVEYVVLGVGINAYPPRGGFPQELESIAGSVFDRPQSDGKNRLAGACINRILDGYAAGDPTDHIERYRSRSLVVGRPVTVLSGGEARKALACGIDDACRLLVRYENGETASLSYGEIAVRV